MVSVSSYLSTTCSGLPITGTEARKAVYQGEGFPRFFQT